MGALTERLDDADASADAIRKTFVAAESTRDEIIEGARSEASTITEAARTEAQMISDAADELHSEIATCRERILTGVYAEAERRWSDMERENAERSTSAEWAVYEATSAADRSIAEIEARSAAREHEAHTRMDDLRKRVTSMQDAASGLERAAMILAESVQHEASVFDLTAVGRLDRLTVERIEPEAGAGPDAATGEEPLLSVAEPADVSKGTSDIPTSRIRQTTGIPLNERRKIARMSR